MYSLGINEAVSIIFTKLPVLVFVPSVHVQHYDVRLQSCAVLFGEKSQSLASHDSAFGAVGVGWSKYTAN